MNGWTERAFDDALGLGRQNQLTIELARRHCLHMEFRECGGQGIAEEVSGLPINMRRVHCEFGKPSHSAAMNLEWIATEFYEQNCIGCSHRRPTGQLPNLASVVEDRKGAAAAADDVERARVSRLRAAWQKRTERRQALTMEVDSAMASALTDVGLIDADPAAEPDLSKLEAAIRRLEALADRAPEVYAPQVVQHLISLVDELTLTDLLRPLRRLAACTLGYRADVVSIALKVLRVRPVVEAAHCLVDLRDILTVDSFDEQVAFSLVLLAGGPERDPFGRPRSRAEANDPAGLRVAADLAPEVVRAILRRMLRTTSTEVQLILPPGVRTARDEEGPDDFERCAAAGALRRLAATHEWFVAEMIEVLVGNLAVDDAEQYGLHPTSDVQRTLALLLATGIADVAPVLERAAEHGGEEYRARLFGVLERARLLVVPGRRWREAGDPNLEDPRRHEVFDSLVTVSLARMQGDWGADVARNAAALLEHVCSDEPRWAVRHVPALLGAFLVTVDRLNVPPTPPLLTIVDQTPAPIAALERESLRWSVAGTARRLLDAVEHAAGADLPVVLDAVLEVLRAQRDTAHEVEVVWRLLPLLGQLGRAHGDQPSVLRRVLPCLYTYLLHTDVALRAAAIDAWTEIASRHPVPSSLRDLLPALTADPYVIVVRSVLQAARRLPWTEEDRKGLLRYAVSIAEATLASDADTLKAALFAVRRLSRSDHAMRRRAELFVLTRAANLERFDLRDLLRDDWLVESRHTPEMAALRLRQARDPVINDRHNARDDEELAALLECGTGLAALPVRDLVDAAIALSPEYPVAAVEFAEVAWRAGRPADAVAVMTAVLEATPDQPVYADRRALADCLRVAAAVDVAAAAGADTPALVEELVAAMGRMSPENGDGDSYQAQIFRQINARLAVRSLLGGVHLPSDMSEETGSTETSAAGTAVDPSAALRWRADRLAVESKSLMTSGQRSTATASYVRAFAGLCDVAVRLLRYDAAELDADSGSAGARVAAIRRARQYAARLERDLASDDPIGGPLAAAFRAVAAVTAGEQVAPLLAGWATVPIPILVVEGPTRRAGRGILPKSAAQHVPEHERQPVAVVLASVDGRLVTGPQVLKPSTVYTLRLDVRLDTWPQWADYLDAELASHLNEAEAQTPTFRWCRPESDRRGEGPLIAEGTLILRFGLPAGRPAPPFRVVLRFRGMQAGKPFQQLCDVAGHVELRLRPFDATRDGRLTQYSVVDERLLELYERLHGAGYDEDQVQAFCRLLTAVCRAGLSMTWEKRYKRGHRVSERSFHDDLYARLLQDPELGGRVERGTPSALGYLDVRHDGITAELKVERTTAVTKESVPKYMGQPTQYAAADGARLSILCVLDMSPKMSPVGTAENYLSQIEPALHGLTNPEAPSLVTAVVVNGNLPSPSSWSRRKIPIQSRSKTNTR